MRKYGKVDANQKEIVEGLRLRGMSVVSTANLGDGMVDIIVGYRGSNYMFEIKDGSKPPSQKKLTDDEKKFHESWKGQISVIECLHDAFVVIYADKTPF